MANKIKVKGVTGIQLRVGENDSVGEIHHWDGKAYRVVAIERRTTDRECIATLVEVEEFPICVHVPAANAYISAVEYRIKGLK